MRKLFNYIQESINEDVGIGLDPLLKQYVYDKDNLSDEDRNKRIKTITAYYKEILDRSDNVKMAYKLTKEFCDSIYIQNYIKKVRKDLGLAENSIFSMIQGMHI